MKHENPNGEIKKGKIGKQVIKILHGGMGVRRERGWMGGRGKQLTETQRSLSEARRRQQKTNWREGMASRRKWKK